MQRSFRTRLKTACLATICVGAAALLYGCGDSAKPMSSDSKAKYMEMYKGGSNGPAGPTKGSSGMGAAMGGEKK
jgi:hypothetical protein